MTTYCSNPRCDNRCGRKPPDNLTEGVYCWADFCEPPPFVCLVSVPVSEEDEAEPDEPTDSELADMPDLPPLPDTHDTGGSD